MLTTNYYCTKKKNIFTAIYVFEFVRKTYTLFQYYSTICEEQEKKGRPEEVVWGFEMEKKTEIKHEYGKMRRNCRAATLGHTQLVGILHLPLVGLSHSSRSPTYHQNSFLLQGSNQNYTEKEAGRGQGGRKVVTYAQKISVCHRNITKSKKSCY